jgi:hypothetical protein
MLRKLARCAEAFRADTGGVILPYVTIMLVVIVGLSVLALDGARYMSLQTQLQKGADALAIAGAAELDRLPDAEMRAVTAINTLLNNASLFGAGNARNVRVADIQFYSQLPSNDIRPMSEATPAASATSARFLSVSVQPVGLSTVLPASLFGGANAVTSRASAVAGFDQVVCDFTPLYICNPFEIAGMSNEQATDALQRGAADPASQRRLIQLHLYRGGGRSYRDFSAGDYGFLESSALGSDPDAITDAVARVHPRTCFRLGPINLRSGSVPSAPDGFNVRFDIYDGPMVANRYNDEYRPSPNVRKGYVGGSNENSCRPQPALNWPIGSPPNQATGFPLDREWPFMGGRMGNGSWDFDTYWRVNHGGAGRLPPTVNGEPANNSNLPSRYFVYRYEIGQGLIADRSPGGESGAPACYGGQVLSDAPDRRVLRAAVINCLSLNLDEDTQSNVPIAAFGKFFMTLPMVSKGGGDIYVETVGLVVPRDGTSDFETVQLYR